MSINEVVENRDIQLAIRLKSKFLMRTQMSSLDENVLKDYLVNFVWKKKDELAFSEAIDDILHISAGDVVDYLSSQAIIVGSKMKIDDFDDLI